MTKAARFLLILSTLFASVAKAAHDYWAMTVVFVLLSAGAALVLAGHARNSNPWRWTGWRWWAAWLALVWISVPRSFDVSTSLWDAWGWTYLAIGYFAWINAVRTAPEAGRDLLWMAGGLIPVVGLALYQQLALPPAGGHGTWHLPGFSTTVRFSRWEIHGTLINSHVFAAYLLSWLFLLKRARSVPSRVLLGLAGIGLLLARSWTAFMVLLVVGAAAYAAGQPHSVRRSWTSRMAGALLLALLALAAVKWGQNRESQHYQPASRLAYWMTSARMLAHHPLSGVGVGAYGTAYPHYRLFTPEATISAHGWLFSVAAEMGLPGLFFALAGLFVLIRRAWNRTWREDETRWVSLPTVACLGAMGLMSIAADYWLIKWLTVLWLGTFVINEDKAPGAPLKAPIAIIGMAALVCFSSFWLSLFQAERLYAGGSFRQALALNRFHAESHRALARQTTDPAERRRLEELAARYKK